MPQVIKTERNSAFFKLGHWPAVLAICLLAIAACKAPPSAPVAPPELAPRKVSDEASKELPPDFWKTMPVYPGARIEHVRKPKGAMREILFSSDGQLMAMVNFYKEELKKNNFNITSSLIMPARKTWSCDFSTKGTLGSVMLFPSDEDKSRFTIDLLYQLPAVVDEAMLEPKEDFDVIGPGEIAQQAPNPSEKAKRN